MLESCLSRWLMKQLLLISCADSSELVTVGKSGVGGGWFWDSLNVFSLSLPFLEKIYCRGLLSGKHGWDTVSLKMELVTFLTLVSVYIILKRSPHYSGFSRAASSLLHLSVLCAWLDTVPPFPSLSSLLSHVEQYSAWDGLKFFRCCINFLFFEKKNDLFLAIGRLETDLLVTVVILTCPVRWTLTSSFENCFWWWCVSLCCNVNSGRSHLSLLNIESVRCDTVQTSS